MGVLPKPYGQSAYYEVHVSARPKPSEPWKPAIMYIESSGAKCYKLDLLQHAITQVDWFSLDRYYAHSIANLRHPLLISFTLLENMIFKWSLPSRKLEDLKSSHSSALFVGLHSGKLFSKGEYGRKEKRPKLFTRCLYV